MQPLAWITLDLIYGMFGSKFASSLSEFFIEGVWRWVEEVEFFFAKCTGIPSDDRILCRPFLDEIPPE